MARTLEVGHALPEFAAAGNCGRFREIDVSLRAVDVIHSFFVPSLRFKQDAVPGLNIHLHLKPTVIGEYEIACAELCGLGHYKMHGVVHVVSQEDFDKWLAAREAEKQ